MKRSLRTFIVASSLVGQLSLSPLIASAQDATPTAPGAEACTVEPRTEAEILAIVEPDGTPIPYEDRSSDGPTGVTVVGPADFATQQAVRDTVYQVLACGNAAMPLSAWALYTDDFLVNQIDGDQIRNPMDDEEPPATLLDVTSVWMLSDGHAFAVAVVKAEDTEEGPPIQGAGLYFAEVEGRWLIDGIY